MDKPYLLQFFVSGHLPPRLRPVSLQYEQLANYVSKLPPSPEQTTALRKLLESKDCAVRCLVADREATTPESPLDLQLTQLQNLMRYVQNCPADASLDKQTVLRMLEQMVPPGVQL